MTTRRPVSVCCSLCWEPSVAICVACDRHYCEDHFAEHRRVFKKYIDDARGQPECVSKCLNEFEQVENELRTSINKWKCDTIERIQCSANETSNELEILIRSHRARFEEESSAILDATSISFDNQVYQIEKLQSDYGQALRSIRLIPHNDRQLVLRIESTHLNRGETSLQDSLRRESCQADVFEPQSRLGTRLIKEPLTETPVGSYWTIGGSDTHLLVQEYETKQLTLFDRHGKRSISMTWFYGEVIRDIQWHHQLQQFFILLDKKLIIFNPVTKYFQDIDDVVPYQSNDFRRCACLDDRLFISCWGRETTIELFQISSWKLQQRWSSPATCRRNELISCIRLSPKEQLALSIEDENDPNKRQFRIELRDLALNTLYIIPLHIDDGIFSRMTPLPDGFWVIVNVDGNYVFIINEHGEFIEKVDCRRGKLRNIALIGDDTVVIRVMDKLLFYDVTFAKHE